MTGPLATVAVSTDGTAVRVVVRGEVDLANGDQVEREIAAAIGNEVTSAIVDLSGVTYLDSVGMRLLFKLTTRLRTAQIPLQLVAPIGSPARRVLEISGLTSLVDVEPTA